jgi:hypothetical protein
MKNKVFYEQVIKIFRDKGYFLEDAWKFGFHHNDISVVKELLSNNCMQHHFEKLFYLNLDLVKVDVAPIKDYFPLVNPRAHALQDKGSNIMNKEFQKTYRDFLMYLVHKGMADSEDKLIWVIYLLLQDRVYEASKLFEKLSKNQKKDISTKIQFDYVKAYISFMTEYPHFTQAREICQEYLDYPVLSWRNLFVEIANQLAEFEETEIKEDHLLEKAKKTSQEHAESTPHFSVSIKESKINIQYRNQGELRFEFYKIDLEILFTQDPFETKLDSSLTNVIPFLIETMKFEKKSTLEHSVFEIPKNLQNNNLLIKVIDSSRKNSILKFTPFNLQASVNQDYGIIKLLNPESGRPMPKIYIKCFAKMNNGQIRFFKDGYTDLRGSFDFASMNTSGSTNAKQFRILVLSKEFGASIFDSTPPVTVKQKEGTAKKIIGKMFRGVKKKKGKKMMKYQLSDYED